MNFPISDFNFDSIQHINNDENCTCFSISSYQEYTLKLSQYRKEEQQNLIQSEKNNVKSSVKLKNNIVTDGVNIEGILNKKILCLDFEYTNKKIINFSNCFEFVVSIFNGKKTENRHYVIEDHNMPKSSNKAKLESKFVFGDSQSIKISDIKPLLENLISDTEAILLHGHSAELKILASNDIEIPDTVKILDTQLLKDNHFRNNSLYLENSMNYNAENQRDKITENFQTFCKVNLTEFDIYVRRYSNFYDYIIINDKGNLIVKYFIEDDTLIIDLIKSNTGFF